MTHQPVTIIVLQQDQRTVCVDQKESSIGASPYDPITKIIIMGVLGGVPPKIELKKEREMKTMEKCYVFVALYACVFVTITYSLIMDATPRCRGLGHSITLDDFGVCVTI